jgi:hypothetical protein
MARDGRGHDPLVDVRDQEDAREAYLDGKLEHRKEASPRGSGTGERLRPIAAGGCWCGKEYDHDWPGKADGEPHPREEKH